MSKQITVDQWTDSLGQTFGPGDYVSIATINDRSPQVVFAKVRQINKTNDKGEPYYSLGNSSARTFRQPYYNVNATQTVVVSAEPVLDGRGFYRGDNRAVSYKIVENIVKLSDEQVQQVLNKIGQQEAE